MSTIEEALIEGTGLVKMHLRFLVGGMCEWHPDLSGAMSTDKFCFAFSCRALQGNASGLEIPELL